MAYVHTYVHIYIYIYICIDRYAYVHILSVAGVAQELPTGEEGDDVPLFEVVHAVMGGNT